MTEFTSHPARSRSAGRRLIAFTLIEVLVVVAVIALLISILMPSLRAARERARAVACGVNLSTTGRAVLYYAEDNKLALVPAAAWAEYSSVYIKRLSHQKFTGDDAYPASDNGVDQVVEFFTCPSDVQRLHTNQIQRRWGDRVRRMRYRVSFGFSDTLSHPLKDPAGARAGTNYTVEPWLRDGQEYVENEFGEPMYAVQRWGDVFNPSGVVMMTDAGDDDLGPWAPPEWYQHLRWDFDDAEDIEADESPRLEVHHRDGNNFMYADHHIEYVKVLKGRGPQEGVPRFPWKWVPIRDLPADLPGGN